MTQRIECVPNISEGKRPEIIEPILDTVRGKPGVKLLDYTSDPSHNRTVVTLIGEPEPIKQAMLDFVGKALELIDLRTHEGQHPRMGAVDVIPFIPVRHITLYECVQISKEFAKDLYDTYGIPSFLYEASASAPHRKNLGDLRRGEFEGMAEKIKEAEFLPDFGTTLHESFGITAIGARPFLIAYNINLNTGDIAIAKQIANTIREKDGGLPGIKAIGVALETGQVQVSMNVTDIMRTSLYTVYEAVRKEAEKAGTSITESEVVGLLPTQAVTDSFSECMQMEHFTANQMIEYSVME